MGREWGQPLRRKGRRGRPAAANRARRWNRARLPLVDVWSILSDGNRLVERSGPSGMAASG